MNFPQSVQNRISNKHEPFWPCLIHFLVKQIFPQKKVFITIRSLTLHKKIENI